mgnify:CR=1 FL=1
MKNAVSALPKKVIYSSCFFLCCFAYSKNKDRKKFDDIHEDILTRSPELAFSDHEKEIMTSWRTSLMGRLSELGEVEWKIATKETGKIRRGTSYYTIPQ